MSGSGRVSSSCQNCRNRKIKCTKEQPTCQRCVRSGIRCKYGRSPKHREFTFVDESEKIGDKVGGLIDGDMRGTLYNRGRARRLIQPSDDSVPDRAGPTPSTATTTGSSIKATSISANLIPEAQQSGPNTTSNIRPTVSYEQSAGGYLNFQVGGKIRFVGEEYWACVCDEAAQLDELLEGQNRYISPTSRSTSTGDEHNESRPPKDVFRDLSNDPLPGVTPWADCLRATKYQTQMPDMRDELPEKAISDVLANSFIRYHQAVAAVVHVPSFMAMYEATWTMGSPDAVKLRRNAASMSLLFSGLAVGAHICALAGLRLSGSANELCSQLLVSATKALRYSNFPRTPTLDSLAAYTLGSVFSTPEEPFTCCNFPGVAVRAAQILGLHRDPSKLRAVPPLTAEIRRRLWWQIYHCDLLYSVASGLPPIIGVGTFEVLPVSEVKDELLGTPRGIAYDNEVRAGLRRPDDASQEDSTTSATGIFLKAKLHESCQVRLLLSKLFNGTTPSQQTLLQVVSDLEKLETDLRTSETRIPEAVQTACPNAPNFNKWAKSVLSALQDKNWAFLYRPLRQTQMSDSLRSRVVQRCQRFVDKFVRLCCLPEFKTQRWSWPGNHQPLHAIMVLLTEVAQSPSDEGADVCRQSVDRAFALCGPDGGLLGMCDGGNQSRPLREGGRESWEFLSRLRARAWKRAGLDPQVMVTPDQVYQSALEVERDEENRLTGTLSMHDIAFDTACKSQGGGDSVVPFTDFALQDDFGWDQWWPTIGDQEMQDAAMACEGFQPLGLDPSSHHVFEGS